jgi:hypothetical protein
MFLIKVTISPGTFKSLAHKSHSFNLLTLSYAFYKSMNTMPKLLLDLFAYYTSYYTIRACSTVV